MSPPERFSADDPREWMNRARSNLAIANVEQTTSLLHLIKRAQAATGLFRGNSAALLHRTSDESHLNPVRSTGCESDALVWIWN